MLEILILIAKNKKGRAISSYSENWTDENDIKYVLRLANHLEEGLKRDRERKKTLSLAEIMPSTLFCV